MLQQPVCIPECVSVGSAGSTLGRSARSKGTRGEKRVIRPWPRAEEIIRHNHPASPAIALVPHDPVTTGSAGCICPRGVAFAIAWINGHGYRFPHTSGHQDAGTPAWPSSRLRAVRRTASDCSPRQWQRALRHRLQRRSAVVLSQPRVPRGLASGTSALRALSRPPFRSSRLEHRCAVLAII